jgi:cysteine desulfurase
MGRPADHARATLRFSLGHTSTADEVAELLAAIGPAVARARTAGLT